MKFAFHKAKDTLFAKLCDWKMEGPYSHVEAMFGPDPVNPSLTVCGSSKFTDGGVRIKSLDLSDTTAWDIVEVPGIDEAKALQWFKDHAGEPYNSLGLLQFICFFPVGVSKNKWFCDQALLAAIGMTNSFRFDPNAMYDVLQFLKGYQAGLLNPVAVTTTEAELKAVTVPETPLQRVHDKIEQAIPVLDTVASAAEVIAPVAALIPGAAPVAAAVEGAASLIHKVAADAPTIEAAEKAVKSLEAAPATS
jgi:hypothetical protein